MWSSPVTVWSNFPQMSSSYDKQAERRLTAAAQQWDNTTKTLSDGERTRWGRFCCKLLRQEAVFLNHPKHPPPLKNRTCESWSTAHTRSTSQSSIKPFVPSACGNYIPSWQTEIIMASGNFGSSSESCSNSPPFLTCTTNSSPQEKPSHVWQTKTLSVCLVGDKRFTFIPVCTISLNMSDTSVSTFTAVWVPTAPDQTLSQYSATFL